MVMELVRKEIKFKLEVPKDIKTILSYFNNGDALLYLVGGCVRDSYMGNTPKDWDLVTNANPDRVLEIVKQIPNLTAISDDSRFGVIRVFFNKDEQYEIVTFRGDADYLDNRRPDTVYFSTIEVDSQRRDFTMNALYYDINNGTIIDFNNGLSDIDNKVIRFIGKPEERLKEDPLRLFRGIRFAFRFNFDFVCDTDININDISRERIRDEFYRTVETKHNLYDIIDIVKVYDGFGLSEVFFGLKSCYSEALQNTKYIPSFLANIIHMNLSLLPDGYDFILDYKYTREEQKIISFMVECIESECMATLQRKWRRDFATTIPLHELLSFIEYNASDEKYMAFLAMISIQDVVTAKDLEHLNLKGAELGGRIKEENNKKIKELFLKWWNK